MDRTVVFVDADYLFAAGSRLIASEKLPRGELHLDYDAVLKLFGDLATQLTGLPLRARSTRTAPSTCGSPRPSSTAASRFQARPSTSTRWSAPATAKKPKKKSSKKEPEG